MDLFEIMPNDDVVKVSPCLESHGLNDKNQLMGHSAAEIVLSAYDEWVKGSEPTMPGVRNAEEFVYKLVLAKGIRNDTHYFPAQPAAFTVAGVPCFRKSLHDIDRCVAPGDLQAQLYSALSCAKWNPQVYKILER